MSDNEHRLRSENPYAAPASTPLDAQPVPAEADDEQYLRVFVGSKADYYVEKWTPLLKSSGRGAGFNWAAFFLTSFWLPYRKMYVITTILYAIILLDTIVEQMLFVDSGLIVGLLVGIICGAYGNRWYLSHARKVISDVVAQGFEEQAALEILSQRGGTSLGSIAAFFLGFVVIAFAVSTVAAR